MNADSWYSARCIFRDHSSSAPLACYEERVILLRAHDFDHALRRAEDEARAYAASLEGVEYLGFLDVYHLFEDSIGDGTEVFSLMRESELGPTAYISQFFDTGWERSRPVEPDDPS